MITIVVKRKVVKEATRSLGFDELGFDELDYVMLTTKWNITQASSRAKENIYKNETSDKS